MIIGLSSQKNCLIIGLSIGKGATKSIFSAFYFPRLVFFFIPLQRENEQACVIKVEIADDDLRELILCGRNAGRYKKIAKDKKFVQKLTDIYNLMCALEHVSQLRQYSFLHYEQLKHISLSSVRVFNSRVERLLFRETETGLEITLIELNEDHYGNKK